MIKIKIFLGAAGIFNVWAFVTRREGGKYRIITPTFSGHYYLGKNRMFISI